MWDVDVTRWRKSSHSDSSGGSCVEVGSVAAVKLAQWQKSSHSDSSGAECVEVAALAPAVAVRDSKDPEGPLLAFGAAAWRVFAERVKASEYDLGR